MPVAVSFPKFMGLFTAAEQAAIVSSTDTQVKLFLLMGAGAHVLKFKDPKVLAGVNYLVTAGLITADRAAAIMAGQAIT